MRRLPRLLLVLLLAAGAGPAWVGVSGAVSLGGDWRTASRASAGLAPDPAQVRAPVVQVYAARAWSWRGLFAVHTWIATKRRDAAAFTVHEVLGWRARQGRPVVVSRVDLPDRHWYAAAPVLLADRRGAGVEAMIDAIEAAVADYPHAHRYGLWPGPNSNTFVAWVTRAVPALAVELPATAIGKDYLADGALLARAPSGGGVQFSLAGLFGVLVAPREGFELNLLGLVFGLDALPPALKLPGAGRIGAQPRPAVAPLPGP
ncbi:MAG: DUF3750 domain-containing protein [Gammaproteobacteria bacterium]